MKHTWRTFGAATLLLAALVGTGCGTSTSGSAGAPADATAVAQGPEQPLALEDVAAVQNVPYRPNAVLVKYQEGVASRGAVLAKSGMRLDVVKRYQSIGVERLRIRGTESVPEAVERLINTPGVEYAEPDYQVKATETLPNDPRFSELWGLKNTGLSGATAGVDIKASYAWDVTQGASNVVVGVIDTGVDYTHPDLAANIWTNPGEIAGNGIDDDANGYVDDVHGINAITGSGNPMDDNNHGTHCSGTIAGVGNNGVGVIGVAPQCKVMALKFMDSTGSGYTSDAVECLDYAVRMGAKVTSNSWGGGGYDQTLSDAITRARTANVLFCAAAGNAGTNNDTSAFYPAGYTQDNVIAVGSHTNTNTRSSFSNYGATTVDLFAPGSSILSTVIGGGYSVFNGTSMATPHVAGVAALVASAFPGSTYAQIRDKIFAGVDTAAAYQGYCVTGGRLNAQKAVAAAPAPSPSPTVTPSPTPSPTVTPTPSPSPTVSPTPTPSPSPTPAPISAKYTLAKGWNYISLPVSSLTTLSSPAAVTSMQYWDATVQAYKVTSFSPTALNALGYARAYALNSAAAASMSYSGLSNIGSIKSVDLYKGWNFVGVPTTKGLTVSTSTVLDLTVPGATAVPLTKTLSNSTTTPGTAMVYRYANTSTTTGTKLDLSVGTNKLAAGKAYWVYAFKSCRLNYVP